MRLLVHTTHFGHLLFEQRRSDNYLRLFWVRLKFINIRSLNVEHLVVVYKCGLLNVPDSKVRGANMGPIWGRQDPGGPHVGPMNFAFWGTGLYYCVVFMAWSIIPYNDNTTYAFDNVLYHHNADDIIRIKNYSDVTLTSWCLNFKNLFSLTSKKILKVRITGRCEGMHRWPVHSPHKGPVMWKVLSCDDVFMIKVNKPQFAYVIMITYLHCCPFVGGTTGDRWIPWTKGQ